jgi:hypothetical protein
MRDELWEALGAFRDDLDARVMVLRGAGGASEAAAGETLVSGTVRGLCSGTGFVFTDRGEFVAKGFEEPVRVYEVRWRE